MRVWSIGEVLWDIFPDKERFGGAPLNVCYNVHKLGGEATLLSAVGKDQRGFLALERMKVLGLCVDHVRQVDDLLTGVAVVSQNIHGETEYVIPRPAAFDRLDIDPGIYEKARSEGTEWLYCGTLLQTEPRIEEFLAEFLKTSPEIRCFYDMNLRDGHWNLPLVQRISGLANLIKLNEREAKTLFQLTQPEDRIFSLEAFCEDWSVRYKVDLLCITLGEDGCFVFDRGSVYRVPGVPVEVCDTVGSGDAFAAAFLHGYHQAWPMLKAARFANALGALVASRAGATPEWTVQECLALGMSDQVA